MTLFKKYLNQINKNINSFAFLGLIIVALLYRLTPVLAVSPNGLMSDDAMLMIMARQFYEGNLSALIHPFWMPLHPFVSAVFFRFVQDWNSASVLTSAVSGTMLFIPVYFVGKYYGGRLVGFLSASFLIFFFPVVHASRMPYTESLQVFLFWIGILFYLKSLDSNKITFAILGGIFWGLTFLTRSEGLFSIAGLVFFTLFIITSEAKKRFKISDNFFKAIIFILFLGYIITNPPFLSTNAIVQLIIFSLFSFFSLLLLIDKTSDKNTQKKVNLLNLSKMTAVTILGILVFYFLYNGLLIIKYKKPLFSAKSSAFLSPAGYFSMNKSGTSTWGQDVVAIETFNPDSEFINKNLYESTWFKNNNIATEALANMFFLIGRFFYFSPKENLVLFFIGLYLLIFKSKDYLKKTFLFLMPMPMIFLISIISIDTSERYLYFASPIISLGIAFGINYFLKFFKSLKIKIPVLLLFIIFVTYFNLNHSASRGQIFPININLPEYASLFTGEKAKAHKEDSKMINLFKDKRVMGRHEGFAFNYRSFFIYSPRIKTLEELVKYARRWHADYIIAGVNDVDNNVSFLYLEPKDYSGLKLELSESADSYIYKVIY